MLSLFSMRNITRNSMRNMRKSTGNIMRNRMSNIMRNSMWNSMKNIMRNSVKNMKNSMIFSMRNSTRASRQWRLCIIVHVLHWAFTYALIFVSLPPSFTIYGNSCQVSAFLFHWLLLLHLAKGSYLLAVVNQDPLFHYQSLHLSIVILHCEYSRWHILQWSCFDL